LKGNKNKSRVPVLQGASLTFLFCYNNPPISQNSPENWKRCGTTLLQIKSSPVTFAVSAKREAVPENMRKGWCTEKFSWSFKDEFSEEWYLSS
jgi:hypothetical protein